MTEQFSTLGKTQFHYLIEVLNEASKDDSASATKKELQRKLLIIESKLSMMRGKYPEEDILILRERLEKLSKTIKELEVN